MAAGFGVRGLGAGADGLVTPASGAVFGAEDSATGGATTGGATTGGVRDDACEAAAASDATGEN